MVTLTSPTEGDTAAATSLIDMASATSVSAAPVPSTMNDAGTWSAVADSSTVDRAIGNATPAATTAASVAETSGVTHGRRSGSAAAAVDRKGPAGGTAPYPVEGVPSAGCGAAGPYTGEAG